MIRSKLILIVFLIITPISFIYSKNGIGYFFKDKRVMKKFHYNYNTTKVLNILDREFNAKSLNYKANDFVLETSLTQVEGWLFFYSYMDEYPLESNETILKKEDKHFPILTTIEEFNADKSEEDILFTASLPNSILNKKIYQLISGFKHSHLMYVDVKPKEDIVFPYWSKSLDLYVRSLYNLTLYFYFEYPKGVETRYTLKLNPSRRWQNLYLNLVHDNKLLKEGDEIRLKKIRVKKDHSTFPSEFSIMMTPIQIYNYPKSFSNRSITPFETFADFEKGHPDNWTYTINNRSLMTNFPAKDPNNKKDPIIIKKPTIPDIAKIETHTNGIPNSDENKNYLSLSIPKEIHLNENILIYFPSRQYNLKKYHKISLWIKGNGNNEEVSLIFQEGRHRYFELVITQVHFTGWKKIIVEIPKEKIKYFSDHNKSISYIKLIGMKIAGFPYDKTIDLGFDQIEGVVDKKALYKK